MELVDAHCHLESEEFEGQVDPVLAEARAAGVVKLVTAAVEPGQWGTSAGLAACYPEVAFAVGVHPWFVREEFEEKLGELACVAERGACAIGEIGLDKKIETPSLELQQLFFEEQIRIAEEIGLPIVVHCRGAFGELLACLKRVGAPSRGGVVHAFSGSVELAEELIGFGFSFSLGASLTYRNSKKRAAILRRIYPEYLLLETDSPDMPPVELRGRGEPNVPANIVYNLRAAAETLEVSEQAVASATTRNAFRVFGLTK